MNKNQQQKFVKLAEKMMSKMSTLDWERDLVTRIDSAHASKDRVMYLERVEVVVDLVQFYIVRAYELGLKVGKASKNSRD